MDFDKLKKEWQQQKAPKDIIPNYDRLLIRICNMERSRNKLRMMVAFIAIFSLMTLGIITYFIKNKNQLTYLGIIITLIGILFFSISFWFNKTDIKRLYIENESINALNKTLKNFRSRKWLIIWGVPIYALLLFSGILIYMYSLDTIPQEKLIIYNLAFIVYMIIVGIIGIRKEMKKFNSEVRPVMEQINKILKKSA